MAQVMVNFRMDEDLKKNMEQVCRQMGLTATVAYTMFARKVVNEKRIPFDVTAEPSHADPGLKLERLEQLCARIRQSLTRIHTAIPSSFPGLSIERIHLLCADELKDKTAAASKAFRAALSDKHAENAGKKDLGVLDEYIFALSSIAEELAHIEQALVPALKAWPGQAVDPAPFEQRLAAVSQRFDALQAVLSGLMQPAAPRQGAARSVQECIQQAAVSISHTEVRAALDTLESLMRRHYASLDRQTKAHLESFYLQTLELTLEELSLAERGGDETAGKAALCLRVISVLSQVVTACQQNRRELSQRQLEAEVTALERLAAMRGETG